MLLTLAEHSAINITYTGINAPSTTAYVISLGIPSLLFLIGLFLLLANSINWFKQKNAADTAAPHKQRSVPALWVLLGACLMAPGILIAAFIAIRSSDRQDAWSKDATAPFQISTAP